MRRTLAAAAALLAVAAPASLAQAGPYTDDLSKCLVKSTTAADQTAFMVWMFSAMAAHPAVKDYATISPAQHEAIATRASALFQRLMTVDCRAESVAALKYEGASAFEASFTVFGQVAMRGLMGDPRVAEAMADINKHADAAKFEALAKEAGLTPPAAAKPK